MDPKYTYRVRAGFRIAEIPGDERVLVSFPMVEINYYGKATRATFEHECDPLSCIGNAESRGYASAHY